MRVLGGGTLGRHGVDLVAQLPDLLGQEGGGVVLGLGVDEEPGAVEEAPLGGPPVGPPRRCRDGVDARPQLWSAVSMAAD